jgi:hypothetical protein
MRNCSVELVMLNVTKLVLVVLRARMRDYNAEATRKASSSTSKLAQMQTLPDFAGLFSPKRNGRV